MAKRQDQAGRTHHRPPPSAHEAPPDRERLLTLAASPAVTVVEAPSGYGKTVLARSWLRAAPAGARTLWVSLSAVARDPAVFLEQLAKALRGACVDRIGGSLDDEAGLAGWFARITDELAEAADPIRLVLDDAHTLAGSASCPYLQRLLLGASPRLQMMVTLQPADADVGLGVMATQQDVRWLTASHLALTAEEIAACAQARGQQLSPAQREGLHDATQGWPALVQLALAVPLERQFVMPDTVAGLGPVRDYIYARFLSHLGPGEHRLMQQLACLGTAPLQLLSTLPGQDLRRDLGRLLALGSCSRSSRLPHPPCGCTPWCRTPPCACSTSLSANANDCCSPPRTGTGHRISGPPRYQRHWMPAPRTCPLPGAGSAPSATA